MQANDGVRRQDLIVIGASAGGVAAIPKLASLLPADLPAAIVVVQHLGESSPRYLVDIVQRMTKLPVRWAENHGALCHGEIVIAPPGSHVLVDDETVVLDHGPRENHARPSINRLFRSAAASRGNSTVGVLLTGMLDDGVAGLGAIKSCGGTTLVQDPADAEFPDMPRNALREVVVDRVLALPLLASALAELAGRPVKELPVPRELLLHAQLDRAVLPAELAKLDALGQRDTARCSDCGGPLWKMHDGHVYRCFLGHTISNATLVSDQMSEIEGAMWTAARSLEEHAFTLSSQALDARAHGRVADAEVHERDVQRLRSQAAQQRALIATLCISR